MTLRMAAPLLDELRLNVEAGYPHEVAGLILGTVDDQEREATRLLPLANHSEPAARRRRYQISPADIVAAELEAERLGIEVIGVFHSHPDHPARASSFDLEWALPWLSYVITSVRQGKADESLSWRLTEDRAAMVEEPLHIVPGANGSEAR